MSLYAHADALAQVYPLTPEAWRFTLVDLLRCSDPRGDHRYGLLDALGSVGRRARAWLLRERQVRALLGLSGVSRLRECAQFHAFDCGSRSASGECAR